MPSMAKNSLAAGAQEAECTRQYMGIDSLRLRLALRAILFANVRSGILPPRSSTAGTQAAGRSSVQSTWGGSPHCGG